MLASNGQLCPIEQWGLNAQHGIHFLYTPIRLKTVFDYIIDSIELLGNGIYGILGELYFVNCEKICLILPILLNRYAENNMLLSYWEFKKKFQKNPQNTKYIHRKKIKSVSKDSVDTDLNEPQSPFINFFLANRLIYEYVPKKTSCLP